MNPIIKSLAAINSDTLNGTNYNNRDYGRKILNYPAMMVPAVQESIIKTLVQDLPENASLIDPFMGASNTLVTGMRYGINVFGQDINPLSVLISQVKTHIYSKDLIESHKQLVDRISQSNLDKVSVHFHNIDKWFEKEVQLELSKIRQAILQEKNLFFRKFYWVALAEVIRLTSNDRTSTFKMHIRTKEDIATRKLSPINSFIKISERSLDDIFNIKKQLEANELLDNGSYKYNAEVKWGNSKIKIKTEKSFDLLVTSPPYGDNQTTVTYGQFSYLPLRWIPVKDIDKNISMDYLSVIQTIDGKSLGGKKYVTYEKMEEKLFSKSENLKLFFNNFSDEEKQKARKVIYFLNDLDVTINKIIQKLNKGAYLVWTIGNRNVNRKEVKNDLILVDLFKSKGIDVFTDLERDILGKRMPGRNNFSKMMSKEKILIFKLQ